MLQLREDEHAFEAYGSEGTGESNKSTFMEALDLPGDHTIYVLLLDSDGNILWRAAGVYEAGEGQAMAEAIAGAMGAHALAHQGGQG